ncbi:hypothetical protein SSTU70S_00692 [Stutzerimonas stutzeri]
MKEQLQQWQQAWAVDCTGHTFEVVSADSGSQHFFGSASGSSSKSQPAFAKTAITALAAAASLSRRLCRPWTVSLMRTLTAPPAASPSPWRPAPVAGRFMATVQAGAVPVPLNSWGLRAEILNALEDVDASLLICDQPPAGARRRCAAGARRASAVEWAAGEGVYSYAALLGEPVKRSIRSTPALKNTGAHSVHLRYHAACRAMVSSHRAVSRRLRAGIPSAFAADSPAARSPSCSRRCCWRCRCFHVSGLSMFLNALRSRRHRDDVQVGCRPGARTSAAPPVQRCAGDDAAAAGAPGARHEEEQPDGTRPGWRCASAGLLDQLIG